MTHHVLLTNSPAHPSTAAMFALSTAVTRGMPTASAMPRRTAQRAPRCRSAAAGASGMGFGLWLAEAQRSSSRSRCTVAAASSSGSGSGSEAASEASTDPAKPAAWQALLDGTAAVRPLLVPSLVLAASTLGRPIAAATLLVAPLRLASIPERLAKIAQREVGKMCNEAPVSWQLLPFCDAL